MLGAELAVAGAVVEELLLDRELDSKYLLAVDSREAASLSTSAWAETEEPLSGTAEGAEVLDVWGSKSK